MLPPTLSQNFLWLPPPTNFGGLPPQPIPYPGLWKGVTLRLLARQSLNDRLPGDHADCAGIEDEDVGRHSDVVHGAQHFGADVDGLGVIPLAPIRAVESQLGAGHLLEDGVVDEVDVGVGATQDGVVHLLVDALVRPPQLWTLWFRRLESRASVSRTSSELSSSPSGSPERAVS